MAQMPPGRMTIGRFEGNFTQVVGLATTDVGNQRTNGDAHTSKRRVSEVTADALISCACNKLFFADVVCLSREF